MIFDMHVLCSMEFCWACKKSVLTMNPYSKEEKAKIVQFYWESKSVVVTQRKFRSHFKTRKAPSYNSILRLSEPVFHFSDFLVANYT